jgi:hypothetical protein
MYVLSARFKDFLLHKSKSNFLFVVVSHFKKVFKRIRPYNRSNFTPRPSIVTAMPLKVTAEHCMQFKKLPLQQGSGVRMHAV